MLMGPVAGSIDCQFVRYFLVGSARARHFRLNCNLVGFQQEIHSRRTASVGGRPLLGSNVVEVNLEQ